MSTPMKVAIHVSFLDSYSDLPKGEQGKVSNFFRLFSKNQDLPGINLERLSHTRSDNLWSARVGLAYRIILFRHEKQNVFILLYIDHHDEAYAWAKNRMVNINRETGSIQVYIPGDEPIPSPAVEFTLPPLFNGIKDKELISLALPEDLLLFTRSILTIDELKGHRARYPAEAFEALMFLAEGESVDVVKKVLAKDEIPQVVDTDNFEKALEHPDSKRSIHVVTDDIELIAILSEPLEKWRVFLHPSQRTLVEQQWSGPVRVLGGAGTGKTVAAMHRTKWLAEHLFTKDSEKILFTTFTRNLAVDIQENLRKICSSELMKRIEVINLDKWVTDFLKRHGYDYKIDYGDLSKDLWKRSLSLAPDEPVLSEEFYREEWERIIQPNGITRQDEYLSVSRSGRGTSLDRRSRIKVWPVFEEYRILMNDKRLREPEDAMREARELLKSKGDVFPYRAIVVDEAQDMSRQAYLLLRQLLPEEAGANTLFIAGDAHQRIYRHKVVLSHCNIDIRGRGRRLRINYRTTDETRAWAVRLLENKNIDDLDGGTDSSQGYKSLMHGPAPVIHRLSSLSDEIAFIVKSCEDWVKGGRLLSEICLVTRTKQLVSEYMALLKVKGLEVSLLPEREAEDRSSPGVRLATMHRVKGLEFSRIIIAGANKGIIPLETTHQASDDPATKQEAELAERSLLYVAATRAKVDLIITTYGSPSPFLSDLSEEG